MADDEADTEAGAEGRKSDSDNWVTPIPPTGTPAFAVMPWPLFLRLRNLAGHMKDGAEPVPDHDIEIRSAGDMAVLAALNQDNPFEDNASATLAGSDEFGNDDDMPMAVLDQLLDGEHPLKVFRRHRGLSQKELAARTGLNATYLSQIETRKRGGSTRVYRLLAAALNVDIGDLIE